MLPFYVYLLKCRDGSYYTGHTDDLGKRIEIHNSGMLKGHTSKRLPVILVWFKETETRQHAIELESKIKKWSRMKKEALIKNDLNLFLDLSKKTFSKDKKIKPHFLK